MDLFSPLRGSKLEERAARWREELLGALTSVLTGEDDLALYDERSQIVVRRDSAHVFIGFDFDEEGSGYLVLCAPLVLLPKGDPLPFYRRLLELNDHELQLGRLALSGDRVVLRCSLPIAGLTEEMFAACLEELMAEADFLDDDLSQDFGLRRFDLSE